MHDAAVLHLHLSTFCCHSLSVVEQNLVVVGDSESLSDEGGDVCKIGEMGRVDKERLFAVVADVEVEQSCLPPLPILFFLHRLLLYAAAIIPHKTITTQLYHWFGS